MRERISRSRGRFEALPVRRRRWIITAAFLAVQVFIWAVLLETLWYGSGNITDTPVYYDYAGRMARGMAPYRDFASEYPPVAMLLFSLPRLLSGTDFSLFNFWFEAEMLLFSCGNVIVLSALAYRQWGSLKKVASTLALYSFFILALGSIVKLRFDLAAAFLILASVACYVTNRRFLAWVLIGIGVMTKVVPALLAPVFLIAHFRRGQKLDMLLGPAAAALTAVIIAMPFIFSAPAGLAGAFLYHAERPLQLESTWATPLLLMSKFGQFELDIMNSYGSHNVFSDGSELLALVSGPVTMLLLLSGYLFFLRGSARMGPGGDAAGDREWQREVTRFSALAIATFIVGGKVLSPQFMIWLLPLIALSAGRDRRLVIGLFTAVLVVTQWEFPLHYWNLYMLETNIIVVVAVRNLLLLGLVASIMAGSRRAGEPAEELCVSRIAA